ncbi:MAG: glycosyltransferase [Nitrococcus sp.]|nr:glycosyltransferase [Nitrococcus sp.]
MSRPPRLAVFLSTSGHSGVDRMMARLLPAVAARGVRVHLLKIDGHGPHLDPSDGLEIHPLGTSHTATALPALVRYLRRYRPAALLSDKDKCNRMAIWARRLARVDTRVVVSSGTHITTALAQRGRLEALSQRLSMRLFYRWADAVVTPSEGAADDLAQVTGLPRGRITAIPIPSVDDALFAAAAEPVGHSWLLDDGVPVVLGVGELSGRKDFATLVRAFARVRRQRVCRLVILGEGKERGALERLSAALDVAGDVALLGFTANPYPYMARCDAFALTSTCEGLGLVIVEALALGARVVATDCPSGPRETLADGRHGFLAPVGDDAAVAEGLLAAIDRRLPAPGPAAVPTFTVESSVQRYLQVLGLAKLGNGERRGRGQI